MVINSANECCAIIKEFFYKNRPHFSLIKEWAHAPYWHVEFGNNDVKIEIDGDMGFSIDIFIDEKKFQLWQYDRSVIEKTTSSKENILYQLHVLKRFLNEVGL